MLEALTPSLPWKRENLGLIGIIMLVMGVKTPPYTATLPLYYKTSKIQGENVVLRVNIWSSLEG